MGKVIVVTSGKGGVGKTTSTASIGAALAERGERVCVVDFDVGLRNLDLVLGAERRVVYDFINVAQGDAKLNQALIRDKRIETLYLLAASQTRDKDALTDEGVERVIGEMRQSFDWILCDSPAGIERGALLAMRFADEAIVVANPEVSSVRDSDRIIGLLDSRTRRAENGERIEKQLLLTRFDPQPLGARRNAERGRRAGHPLHPAARHHPGERGHPARLQPRRADHDERHGEPGGQGLQGRGAAAGGRKPAARHALREAALPHPPVRTEGGMNLLSLFKSSGTAPVARERLQILLAHERVALGPEDLVGKLRDDLIATILRHVEIDPDKVIVKMDRDAAISTLEIDIEIPSEKIVGDGKRRPRGVKGRMNSAA